MSALRFCTGRGSVHQTARAERSPEDKFNIEKLKRESTIDTIEPIGKLEELDSGLFQKYGLTLLSGHQYAAFICAPDEQSTDVPTIATTAWGTSLDGHNSIIGKSFMEVGNTVFYVGPEGGYHKGCGGNISNSLARSAAAVLQFSLLAPELAPKSLQIDEIRRFLIGDSRGAMVGMGIKAFDKYFGQDIVFGDLTAACFPRRLNTLVDLPKLLRFVLQEPVAALKLLASIGPEAAFEYPSTLDLINPFAVAHQLAMAPAIFSGEAGDLARLTPLDSALHMTTYNDDFVSMHNEWLKIFDKYSNVRITPLNGSHLTLADPLTRAFVLARNQAAREQYVPGIDMNSATISERAHAIIEASDVRSHKIGRKLLLVV